MNKRAPPITQSGDEGKLVVETRRNKKCAPLPDRPVQQGDPEPVVAALSMTLDDIVTSPRIDDPRVLQKSTRTDGRILTPLSQQPGEPQAFKITIAATDRKPVLRTHGGYEWIYVLAGRLRLVLGEHDIVMGAGEAAEFDTKNPHWFGATGTGPVEILSMFGKQGERIHLRAKST